MTPTTSAQSLTGDTSVARTEPGDPCMFFCTTHRRNAEDCGSATPAEELEYARRLLVFADGLAVANTDFALADLYAEDCSWAQETLRSAGCHPRGAIPAARNEVERLRRVEQHAREVMEALERHGAGIVGHLLDTDDNSGEYLRRALNGGVPSDG